jgi:phosphohistidine phosphatase
METVTIVAEGLGYPVDKIWKEQALYEAGVEDYLDVIRDTPDEVNSLMVVGHNFTISHVANYFLGDVVEMLPTSGLVGISFKTDRWDEVKSVKPKQLFVVFPKILK